MRIARALAAAALSLGLASTLSPAQAAPMAPPVAQVVNVADEAPAPTATKVTAKAPKSKTKVGKYIKITGKLTRKDADGSDRPLAKQEVEIIYPTGEAIGLLGTAKTSKNGKYTAKVRAKKWMVGQTVKVYVVFDGNAENAESQSKAVVLKVKKK